MVANESAHELGKKLAKLLQSIIDPDNHGDVLSAVATMIADKGDELAMTLALLGASAQQRVEENAAHDKIEKTFKDARKATSFNGKGKARATPRKSIRTRRDQPGWQIKGNRLECEELALRFASCLATKVHE